MPSIRSRGADPAELRLERLSRLQGLTETLSAALTPEEVGAIIFDTGLGLVGAQGVTLFWEIAPGELELVHGLGLSEEFVRRFRRVRAETDIPSVEAYRTGEPVWLGSQAELEVRFPGVAAFAAEEGVAAWAAIPLVSDRSRGALGLRFAEPRTFDAEERSFVLAVARQCAQALERARLFDAQKKLADRLSRVYATASALSGAATPREVAEAAFRALGAIGAAGAEIHALDAPDRLSLLARARARPTPAPVPLDAPAPAAEVVRTGKSLWIDAAGELAAQYPAYAATLDPPCTGGFGAVPLLASGHTLGAFAVWFGGARAPDADEKAFVRLVAQPCAQALERARSSRGDLAPPRGGGVDRGGARRDARLRPGTRGAARRRAPVRPRQPTVRGPLRPGRGRPRRPHARRVLLAGGLGEQLATLHARVASGGRPVGDLTLVGEAPSAPGTSRRFVASGWPVLVRGEIAGVGIALLEG